MMFRRQVVGFLGCLFFLSVMLQACGEPNVCQNDKQCTGERVCLYGKCVDPSEKPKEAVPAEPKQEAQVEVVAEKIPEAGPEEPQKEASPEVVTDVSPPGIRKEGQTCDPRGLAWWFDRCEPGFACAETRQAASDNGAPQPVGVCLKACSKENPSVCPAGTRCAETYETKTRQATGIYVCAKESKDGERCANLQACADGLTCMRYGTTGTYWVCQKDCSADASVCGAGKNCEALSSGDSTKACKTARKIGEQCVSEDSCETNAGCVPSLLVGVSGRCLKKCGTIKDCEADEVCRGFNGGGVVGVFCFKASESGGSCLGGKQCKNSNELCVSDNPNFPLSGLCLKSCSRDTDCASGERCDLVAGSSTTRVCKLAVPGGAVLDGHVACATGSRSLQISSSTPALCLPDCSLGTATSARLCGVLTAGIIYDLVWLDDQNVLATGPLGEVFSSKDAGATWARRGSPRAASYRGIAAAKAGKLVLMVGERGILLRSEDGGTTWAQVFSSVLEGVELVDVAVSESGATAVIIGSQQKAFRSVDEGKTWQAITFAGLTNGVELKAIAVGGDQGTTPSPKWLIVGTAATILQSTDGGQMWSPLTVTGVTEDLNAVALARDAGATGKVGLIAGNAGVLLSTSDGQTWQKDTSGVTSVLTAAAIGGGKAYASGAGGVVLREDTGAWVKATFPENRTLHGLAVRGANVLATGDGGTVFSSRDDAKTWTALTGTLARCVGLRNSQGNNAGGVCLLTCDPLLRGADCPPEVSSCQAVSLGSTSVNICQPNTSTDIPGAAQEGEACDSATRAPDKLRCAAGLRCLGAQDGSASRCVKPCDPANPSCDAGKTCLRLGTSGYCGTSTKKDEACNAADAKFCAEGLACQRDTNAQFLCQEDPIKNIGPYEPCDNGINRCPSNHLCLGGPDTPYRSYCAPTCVPGANPSSCPSGWECFSLNNGGGACLERCPTPDYKCTAKHLSCQTVSSRGGQHCL